MKWDYAPLVEKKLINLPDRLSDLNIDRIFHPAETHYVSDTGSDTTGDGSQTNPWATMAHALSHIQNDPVFTGNHTIKILSDITESFTIPTLIYNGFELIIEGALTEVLSDTATGGANQVNGVSKGYMEKTTAAYIVNQFRNKLMMNPSGHFVAVDSNTATRILYAARFQSFTLFSSGETVKVYDWTYTIVGKITVSEYAKVRFVNLNVLNTGDTAVNIQDFAKVTARKCCFVSNHTNGAIYVNVLASLNSLACVYMCPVCVVRLDMGATYYCRDLFTEGYGGDIIFLQTSPSGLKTGLLTPLASRSQLFNACFNSEDLVSAGSRGLYTLDNGSTLFQACFVDRFETCVLAQFAGFVRDGSNLYTNFTTQYNPAAATDPSYIV